MLICIIALFVDCFDLLITISNKTLFPLAQIQYVKNKNQLMLKDHAEVLVHCNFLSFFVNTAAESKQLPFFTSDAVFQFLKFFCLALRKNW